MSSELMQKLQRRAELNDAIDSGSEVNPTYREVKSNNPYVEFQEFSRKQIQEYDAMFKKYDVDGDKFLDFEELKRMMELLGAPQTHLALKEMIRMVDEDGDNRISFREFLLIFRKAVAGELSHDTGLYSLYANISEIDVDQEGVGGAKKFFEAKVQEQSKGSKFEREIREEREEKKRIEEEKAQRRAAFKNKASMFQSS